MSGAYYYITIRSKLTPGLTLFLSDNEGTVVKGTFSPYVLDAKKYHDSQMTDLIQAYSEFPMFFNTTTLAYISTEDTEQLESIEDMNMEVIAERSGEGLRFA